MLIFESWIYGAAVLVLVVMVAATATAALVGLGEAAAPTIRRQLACLACFVFGTIALLVLCLGPIVEGRP